MKIFNDVIKVTFSSKGHEIEYNDKNTRFRNPMYLNPENSEHEKVLQIVMVTDGLVIGSCNYKISGRVFDFDHSELLVELTN